VTIPESDWKKFKPLRDKALTRLCDRILAEVEATLAEEALSSHEKYVKIYAHIRDHDKALGRIFDGYSRSRALSQLAMMQSYELLEPEELTGFSQSTQEYLKGFTR
jgi:hypothetical protein